MIFDLTRRVSGGGSGPSASDAILTVTVPTGSTVTMTKGGLSLTPTMWVQAADNTLDCALFVIAPSLFDSQNAWTVTATLSGDTASDTVTIDSNEQYDVVLSYRIPGTYQEVEFISASGGQYIDTGILPTHNTSHHIKILATASSDFFYGYGGNDSNDNRFFLTGGQVYFDVKSSRVYISVSNSTNRAIEFELGNLYINDLTDNLSASGTIVDSWTGEKNIFLFKTPDFSPTGKGNFYFAKIYSSGTLVADLIPCYRKSDSVAGMWDSKRKTFLTNAGTGTFGVGPDVT